MGDFPGIYVNVRAVPRRCLYRPDSRAQRDECPSPDVYWLLSWPSLNSRRAEPKPGQRIRPQPKELDMSTTRTLARNEISRLNLIFLLALGLVLVLPAASRAEESPPIAQQIAKTYALDSFGQIGAIRYT